MDKIGRPFYVDCPGRMKLKEIMEITEEERLKKFYYQLYEELLKLRFLACSELYDRNISQTF